MDEQEKEQLEALVDRTSLAEVIKALAEVCDGKADQARGNWQDEALAQAWAWASAKLGRLVEYLEC
jgi:hypothetical protein